MERLYAENCNGKTSSDRGVLFERREEEIENLRRESDSADNIFETIEPFD